MKMTDDHLFKLFRRKLDEKPDRAKLSIAERISLGIFILFAMGIVFAVCSCWNAFFCK